jgi:antitoxin component of MazEF toxin-antitoxin module
MDLEKALKDILFNIGKEIKIHTIGKDMIIEIDYDKYVSELVELYSKHASENDV